MKDPWFDNIQMVSAEEAIRIARVHSAQKATQGKPWLHVDQTILTVIHPPRNLREALIRGR